MHRLRLSEIFYFEVVDDRSFLYTQAAVFEAKENIPAQKLYRKMGFVFCGEADMYGHSYFLCERILTNGLDEIEMHLTGTFPQVTG